MMVNLSSFIVHFLASCCASYAMAKAPPAAIAKSYAVFIASYNVRTHEAHGGVAGTAFFTSQSRAITAYHVLQPLSWATTGATGEEQRQIWLVHEGEPAIELKPENMRYKAQSDLSYIELGETRSVSKRYVFAVDENAPGTVGVATEGFEANSAGPTLALENNHLRITAVPRLKRIHAEGALLKEVRVNLHANDVHLEGTPCFRLSYRPIVGMSGGPVIAKSGKVIGVNSFADPQTRAQTWAVRL